MELSPSDVIVANGLTHSYGEGELKNEILHQLDFRVLAKEVTLLVGPSGSGKSTLPGARPCAA